MPPAVVAMEAFADDPGANLFPEEEAVVAPHTSRAGRRAVLADGGDRQPHALRRLPGRRGRPVVVLGLDAEPNEALPDGVLDMIALEDEKARLAELTAAAPAVCWDRLLFSAKESVYKARLAAQCPARPLDG